MHREFIVTLRADATFDIRVYASSEEKAIAVTNDTLARGYLQPPQRAIDWTVVKATPAEGK